MAPRHGLVGGTALQALDGEELRVETPWGPATVSYVDRGHREILFLERHATPGGRVPPHRVPHRRNLWALHRGGADAVVAVHTVGALDPALEPGTLAAPDGLVDATGTPPTVHDDEPVHVDLDPPFCPRVRSALLAADPVETAGAYVQTRGPRFETPGEVALLRRAGDLVGMTAAGEATVARELGLCYGSLSLVANPAAGLGDEVAAGDVAEAARDAGDAIRGALDTALDALGDGDCACSGAPDRGRTT